MSHISFRECLDLTYRYLRSDSHNILPSSGRPRYVTDEATGRALLVRYSLGKD
jgi:hypothetical protein